MSTLLLLHAYPLSSRMWREQIGLLEAEGHRVLAPDHPGFGGTPPLAAPSMDGFAQHALAALDRADAAQAVVVGLSMGGYAALRLLALAPDRVAGLLLANTRADADSAELRARRLEQIARIEREGTGWLADAMLPVLLGPQASPALRAEVRAMIEAAPPAGVMGALRAMAERPDSSALLQATRVPVAFVSGERDALTGPSVMRPMKMLLPGSHCANLAGAGHLSNLEAPAAFASVLRELLARVG